LRRQTLISTF
jgi:proteasomal ATPase-associated factor 1